MTGLRRAEADGRCGVDSATVAWSLLRGLGRRLPGFGGSGTAETREARQRQAFSARMNRRAAATSWATRAAARVCVVHRAAVDTGVAFLFQTFPTRPFTLCTLVD